MQWPWGAKAEPVDHREYLLDVTPGQAAHLGLGLIYQAAIETIRGGRVHLHIHTSEDE